MTTYNAAPSYFEWAECKTAPEPVGWAPVAWRYSPIAIDMLDPDPEYIRDTGIEVEHGTEDQFRQHFADRFLITS